MLTDTNPWRDGHARTSKLLL